MKPAAFLLLVLAAPACLLATDFEDLAGSADASPDAEGGDAAPPPPPPADATTNDAGGSADAGPFCDRAPATFCADFDHGFPVAYDWLQERGAGDVIALDPLSFEGTHSALLRRSIAGCTPLNLTRKLEAVATSLRIEMMIRPSHPDGGTTGGYFGAAYLRNAQSAGCVVTFDRPGGNGLGFKEEALRPDGGAGGYVNATRWPLANQWTSMVLLFTRSAAGSAQLTVTVADGGALTNHSLGTCRFGGTAELAVGPGCGEKDVEIRYDSIRITAE